MQNEEVCEFYIYMNATGAVSIADPLFTHATKNIVVISKYSTINSSYKVLIKCNILYVDGTDIHVAYEVKQQ